MAISQTITALPVTGHRGVDARTVFVTKVEAFSDALQGVTVAELNTFATQANALETNVNAKEVSAVLAEASAVASANFKGTRTNETTIVGQSWLYNGIIYGVLIAGNTSPISSPSNWFALSIASSIQNTPSGNISATTVQGALNEMDSEKASKTELGGRRNYLINGNFKINERAYVSGTATVGANQYIFDRWYIPTTGQNATFTTTNGIITVTAPASGIVQKIENISNNGGVMTVSYTGTATLTVTESTDNVTYTAVIVVGNTFTPTAGTYIKITLASGTVSLVKLEDGSVATNGWHPYDGEFGGEMQACARYLPVAAMSAIGQVYNTTTATFVFPFGTGTRIPPTGIIANGTYTLLQANGTSIAATSPTYITVTGNNYSGIVNFTGSGLVAGNASRYVCASGTIIFTGCEL